MNSKKQQPCRDPAKEEPLPPNNDKRNNNNNTNEKKKRHYAEIFPERKNKKGPHENNWSLKKKMIFLLKKLQGCNEWVVSSFVSSYESDLGNCFSNKYTWGFFL